MKREIGRVRPAIAERIRPATERRKPCFTLEVNQRPVLVLLAASLSSAQKRVAEDWFVEELGKMHSNGRPILSARDTSVIRLASPEEAARLEVERSIDKVRGEDTKYVFAFLVPIDNEPN